MKLFTSVFFACVLALGTVAFAQNQTPPSQQQSRDRSDTPKTSITGCLIKGSSDGNYVITDQASGDKVPFSGPVQLDRYVNQTVKLTGTMSGAGAAKTFSPEAIAQVAPSCTAGK